MTITQDLWYMCRGNREKSLNISVGRDVCNSPVIEQIWECRCTLDIRPNHVFNTMCNLCKWVRMLQWNHLCRLPFCVLIAPPLCPQYQSGGHRRTDRGGHGEGGALYQRGGFSCPQMMRWCLLLLKLSRHHCVTFPYLSFWILLIILCLLSFIMCQLHYMYYMLYVVVSGSVIFSRTSCGKQ